ncbi:hypothetical protein CAT7_00875 [Carnobacterium sp. AT7]|uniref:reverse transcriptase domain-containing protein n=1 Tax=Carnobacterium sp. AT7 TaxID=333990 RepID=UPI00015F1721|nr:reverse transcriptase domain-containing protein [Carnobacterium sp. AT7]EDP68068.1 hypothetical protein CAT7_00875 [Carnobacterium sp. AT7]
MTKRIDQLKTEDSNLISNFRKLNSFYDIASLLEVTPKFLYYILNVEKSYTPFKIPKKNGDMRTIMAPSKNLKIIQKKLSYILTKSSSLNKSAHGFVQGKSIITNAAMHVNKKWVLNFDLKNYFDQFNQGKLIGFFKSYYKFNDEVIGILVSICCHNNILPQGAPTSPILTNILTYNFDKQMSQLCRKNNYIYTRYVDDITISTDKYEFQKRFVYYNENNDVQIGNAINKILEKTNFEINTKKTRLRINYQNQTVTGITVNRKLNVSRKYIRKTRAILHNLKVNNDNVAQKKFDEYYPVRHYRDYKASDKYNVVKGMIEHVAQVKGRDDRIFKKLALSFNDLNLPEHVYELNLYSPFEKNLRKNCFVVEIEYSLYGDFYPATASAFLLKGVGVITSAHTFKQYLEYKDEVEDIKIWAFRENETTLKRPLDIKNFDFTLDFAICHVAGINHTEYGFEFSKHISLGEDITLLGFPQYQHKNLLNKEHGVITQEINEYFQEKLNPKTQSPGYNQKRYGISSQIFEGNSGGPVLNSDYKVIGIATKGITSDAVKVNTIVPISDIFQ